MGLSGDPPFRPSPLSGRRGVAVRDSGNCPPTVWPTWLGWGLSERWNVVRPMPGGRRRVDRVLSPEFTGDLAGLSMQEVRERRQDAMQEEADLSYVRRMLQGRIDILDQELQADGGDSDEDLVARLTRAMVSHGSVQPSSSRHLTMEPSRLAERRRYVERLIADIGLSDPSTMTPDEVRGAVARLQEQEREVSEVRSQVHVVIDALTAELAARYRSSDD